jgi:hypothetical protein
MDRTEILHLILSVTTFLIVLAISFKVFKNRESYSIAYDILSGKPSCKSGMIGIGLLPSKRVIQDCYEGPHGSPEGCYPENTYPDYVPVLEGENTCDGTPCCSGKAEQKEFVYVDCEGFRRSTETCFCK